MQEEEIVMTKHVSSKGRVFFDNQNIVKQRLYFLIIQYLAQDENFDRQLLTQIKEYAESNHLFGHLLSLDGGQVDATFDELNFQQKGSLSHPTMFSKDENLNSILSIYQRFSAQRAKSQNASTYNVFTQKMLKLTTMLQDPAMYMQPTRELFIKRKKQNYNYNNRDEFSNDTFILRFQHLKTCFGHAYSADSGSVNEESGEPYIPIYNSTFDKSGRIVITADEEGLIKIWSSENGLLLSNLKGHTSGILSNDISPCNKYLVTCSIDFTARVWDIFNQRCLTCFRSREQLNAVVFYKYQNEFTEQLYLLMMTNVGNILIYKEDQFKENGGGINPNLQPVMTLAMRKHKKMQESRIVDKESSNEAVCIETHPSGYLVVGTETGEILVWEKIHTLENRNRQVFPFIEKKEHSKNCQLIKFSPNGEFMITASFDGYAKIWPWKKLIENDKKLSEHIYSIYFDNSNKCEKNCWNVAFSCKNKYAFATFTRKMKRTKEVETVVYVHDLIEKKIKHEFTQQNTSARLQDHILVFEPHPTQENILLTADYAGQIILYDVSLGCILNIFQERGYHIGYPNLEVPVLDGCWAPDGLKFIASTYYGSFSLYGYDNAELYKTTPTEQFFANDTEIFIYSDNHVPLAVDDDVEINTKTRGKICDYQRIPYRFEYNNNLKKLYERGFFEETSDVALKCIEDKIGELKLQEQELKQQDETNTENLVDKYLKNQEKDKNAYHSLCNQLRDSYNNANNTMEGSMRVDFNERMEMLKKMSKKMIEKHQLTTAQPIESVSNDQIFNQISQPLQRAQSERQILEPVQLVAQESELLQQRNNTRRRVVDDEDLDLARPTLQSQSLSRRQSQMPAPAALNRQNSRGGQRARSGRARTGANTSQAAVYNDDFGDSFQSEEEVASLDDSEVNIKDINEDEDEYQKDLLEEFEMYEQPRRNGSGFDANDRRNQSNNRNRNRRGGDDFYDDEEEEEKKDSSNQRRTRLKRFSNNNTSTRGSATTTGLNQTQTEGQQRQGTLRYNRNTRSSYSMQYTPGDDLQHQQNYGYNSGQENEVTTTSRLRRRNQHIIEEDNDEYNLNNNTNSNHYSLRQTSTSHHPQPQHNVSSTNTHQTRSSAAASHHEQSQNQKQVKSSSRRQKSKKNRMYGNDEDYNSNMSESEANFSDENMEEEDDEVDMNYEDEDDFEYKLRKPKKSGGAVQSSSTHNASQNAQSSRTSGRSLRASNANRKKVQDSDEEEDDIPTKQKNRSSKKNGIINDDDDEEEDEAEALDKFDDSKEEDNEELDNFDDEDDEDYTEKRKKTYLKKRSSQEAGMKKNGINNANRVVKKIKTNDSDHNKEDNISIPDEKKPICERCDLIIEGEMKKCHICKKKYHEEHCSKYRGCLRDKRYFCFDCYAHNSTVRTQKDEQDKRSFTREYLEKEINDPYQYVPQINDMLYYVFQAHEEFFDKYFEIFDYAPLIDRLQKEYQKANPNGKQSNKKAAHTQKSSKVIDSEDEYHADEPSSYYQKKGQMFQNLEYHILPFLNYKELIKPTLCQVSSIEYVYPMLSTKKLQEKHKERPIFMLIQLKILETGDEFSVYFSNSQNQCSNFLIPQEIYDHSIHYQSTIKTPQSIQFYYRHQIFTGQIIDVSPKEEFCKQHSEYQKLKVKVDIPDEKIVQKLKMPLEGSNLTRISSWEVIHDVRRTSSPQDYPSEDACLSKEETEQIDKLIQALIDNQSDITCYFEEAVNLKKYKHYYEFVEVPMDISKIRRRLLNGYYRSLQSIYSDINLIDNNALKFNTPDSPICESSKKIKDILIQIVTNFQNIDQCLNLIVKNKKNHSKVMQALFPNHSQKNEAPSSNGNNIIQIKLPPQPQQYQPSLIPVPIEKPPGTIHNPQMQAEQYQQKFPNVQSSSFNQQQQQQHHQQQYEMNNNSNNNLNYQQSYQMTNNNGNNNSYQQNQNNEQNEMYMNNPNPIQNGAFNSTGLINENSNQYYSNNSNYNSQAYDSVNNFSQNAFNYDNDQGFQGMNQEYQTNDYNTQNLGQQNSQQNMMGSQIHNSNPNQNPNNPQQQRTTRSGRLTRNSSKFDYDQLDPRKN